MRYLPISRLVVHHSAITGDSPQFDDICEHHKKKGWGDKSAYHFFIEKSGSIRMGRDEIKEPSAGTRSWICNQSGIHICVAGNFETEQPTEEQLNTLKKMIQRKMKLYKIKPENVVGHRDCSPTLCPGRNLYDKLKVLKFTPPKWSEKGIRWAAQEKIIKEITGEPVSDYRLAAILHNFYKKFIK